MKPKSLIAGLLLLAGAEVSAHDFSATVNGQCLYFDIVSTAKQTAAVTFKGSVRDRNIPDYSGVIEIPSKVKHNNVVYRVSSIGRKAFANSKSLKGIVIPSGVETIGDFAFEGCDSLSSVVFPGNPVSLGQGVFFRCSQIAGVTIGSDWKTLDFTMFRWSDKLTAVHVPAKVEKIRGLKKLKCLKLITVDPNNARFTSVDGMLYSKDGSILYACPRAYVGKVKVSDGTETVQPGALLDCVGVTSIDFPASIKKVSFRETSRMKNLETIVMRAEQPISTGYISGQGTFLFLTCNSKVVIAVPSASKSDYVDSLATEPGEYSEALGGIPFEVVATEMPAKKNIKGVKNFDKY